MQCGPVDGFQTTDRIVRNGAEHMVYGWVGKYWKYGHKVGSKLKKPRQKVIHSLKLN